MFACFIASFQNYRCWCYISSYVCLIPSVSVFLFSHLNGMILAHAGYIDLSKRRVDTEEIAKCESRWNKSKQVQSIMTRVAKSGMSDDSSAAVRLTPSIVLSSLSSPLISFYLSRCFIYHCFVFLFDHNRAHALDLARSEIATFRAQSIAR
jgi:hypothetical protein